MSVILETKQLCKFYGAGENPVSYTHLCLVLDVGKIDKNKIFPAYWIYRIGIENNFINRERK